ncbi:MAG TPA: hypothetical protein ENH82_07805, partial [bacterium]|nr:hypothetical protein [bacterium]
MMAFTKLLKNNFLKLPIRVLRQRPFKPSHFRIFMGDISSPFRRMPKDIHDFSGTGSVPDHSLLHLKAAMDWLCFAHDVNNDGGVAFQYSFSKGWGASYPETTGYIIPTFFDYHKYSGQPEYKDRAIRMAKWLLSLQWPSGAFPGLMIDHPDPKPSIFNTGQIMFGLMRTYKETGEDVYLDSVVKSANWLVTMQDQKDGAWRQFACNDCPHTYYTRVAWALLELYQLTSEQSYKQSAIKNLDWAMNNQTETGWYM